MENCIAHLKTQEFYFELEFYPNFLSIRCQAGSDNIVKQQS